jgi:predicted DNA-binding transcriptional regulator YafY
MSRDLLCQAIANRQIVSFRYKGTLRRVEPHLVGYDSSGDLTLSAWQLSGGTGQGWRDFHVARLSGLATTDETFERARDGYNPMDSTLDEIVCRL